MTYEMGGTILSTTVKEKDLGVTMNANMKVSEQCRIAASKGNQVLGMIRRNITYKDKSLIGPLYKAIVRPHYEMGGTILCKTVKEKDLGVTINANMKVSEQCRIAASKGNQIL